MQSQKVHLNNITVTSHVHLSVFLPQQIIFISWFHFKIVSPAVFLHHGVHGRLPSGLVCLYFFPSKSFSWFHFRIVSPAVFLRHGVHGQIPSAIVSISPLQIIFMVSFQSHPAVCPRHNVQGRLPSPFVSSFLPENRFHFMVFHFRVVQRFVYVTAFKVGYRRKCEP